MTEREKLTNSITQLLLERGCPIKSGMIFCGACGQQIDWSEE